MGAETLRYEVTEHVATITIARSERRNAMDLATLDALHAAWSRAEEDADVRAVILTGQGEVAFSAGADLKDFAPESERRRVGPTHPAFFPELVLRTPLIAAVNGHCLAGGLELLLASDIRIAARHATFGIPEPQLGLFPAGGSAVRAPRRLGWAAAMELLLTGEPIDAATALSIGLVNRVVDLDELMPTARAIAGRIAANSPVAVRTIKECALASDGVPLEEALARQAEFAARVHAGPDAAEGMRAFREKRSPRF